MHWPPNWFSPMRGFTYASRLLEGRVMNSIPLWKEKLMPCVALELEELDLDRFKLIIMIVLANQPGEEHLQDWLEALIFDNLSGRVH